MKTLIFLIVVLVSSYYLLSKTDKGGEMLNSKLLSRYLPQQQIDKASEALLKNVDARLQALTTKIALEQQEGMQLLQQGISALSQQLSELKEQQKLDNQPDIARKIARQPSQSTNISANENARTTNVSMQETRAIKQDENDDIQAKKSTDDEASVTQNVSIDMEDERRALQRQKQTSLQFITSRMEQMAIQVSSGTY